MNADFEAADGESGPDRAVLLAHGAGADRNAKPLVATARALAAFVLRGVQCGAVGADDVQALAGVGIPQLTGLAHPRLAHTISK